MIAKRDDDFGNMHYIRAADREDAWRLPRVEAQPKLLKPTIYFLSE